MPEAYAVTNKDGLFIRSSMSAEGKSNIVGKLQDGEPFIVYKKFPRGATQVWALISDDPKDPNRFVCLKKDKQVFAEPAQEDTEQINTWANSIDAWARSKGFTGPRPQ